MQQQSGLVVDTMDELIRQMAKANPEGEAMVFEGEALSYGEMNDRSNQAAQALLAQGVKKGDRIAWLAQNVGCFWEALFGAIKIGAVLTPVNWRLAPPEIAAIIEDSGAEILVTEPVFLEMLQKAGATLPKTVFIIGSDDDRDFIKFVAGHEAVEADHTPSSDDVILQLYTSGTTGLPKGVLLTHKNYAESMVAGNEMALIMPQSDDEAALHALPHFHVAGVNFGLMAIARNMTIIQHRMFDPAAIVKEAQGPYPLNSFFVPAMIMMILQAAKEMSKPLDRFVCVSYGAAPMPEPLLDAAMAAMPRAKWTQFYGATETTGGLTCLQHEDHAPGKPQRKSAGKTYPGSDLRIVDPETRKPVAPGETGEIETKSGFLMQGYWNRRDATDEVLQDGWYSTGDAGFQDENGFVYVVDRIKDMIISGGENIYPAELEKALSKHPAIAECAAIGIPDEKWGEVVKMCAVCRKGEALSEQELIEFLSTKIAKFKLPRFVEFIDMLPRNPSGKVLKTKLRDMHQG